LSTNISNSEKTSQRRIQIARRVVAPFNLLAALLFTLCLGASAQAPRFVTGQILIKPKAQLSDSSLTERLEGHGAWQRQRLHRSNVRVINVSESRAEAVLAALRRDPDIEFAERDGIARAAFVPNDAYVTSGREWHLAKIQAPQAWDTTAGAADVVVAILDSGINAAHPDLARRVLPGYDFVSNDSDPSDDFGHGTAVAGVVVAAGNNRIGVAGVAWRCAVLPVKVVNSSGFASYSALAQGIRYAVDQGARVINISIAGDSPSSTLQEAINYAWNSNVVIVAAAGNNANDVLQYPAACDHVVAVSATEPDDSLASFSSFGSSITLSAPGDNIWTTQSDLSRRYGSWRGTSFASPVVAGVAALAVSANPSLSNTQLVSLLEATADDRGAAGYDVAFGFGRVNAFRALTVATGGSVPASEPNLDLLPPGVTLTATPRAGARLTSAFVSLAGTASDSSGLDRIEILVNDAPAQTAIGTSQWSAQINLEPGLNLVRVRSVDLAGNVSKEVTRTWFYVVLTPLSLKTNGLGRVTPNLNGRLLEIGRHYVLRAVPGPGQVFAGWDGADSQSPVLTFIMQTNLTLVANFVPSPFPAVRGSYAGLMANTNDVTPESSGYFMLNVTAAGRFSGKVVNGFGYGFAGQFNLAGDATVNVPRGALSPLHLTLHTDLTNGTDQVTGSATDGVWSADLSSDHNVFDARLNPAEQAGLRTFLFENNAAGTQAASCSDRIYSNGVSRLHGKLLDGRPFARISALAKTGDCPFYISLNRSTEVVIGWLNFPAGGNPTTEGSVLWVKTGTNSFAATLRASSLKSAQTQ
jgi:subtilisin family serine protease